jgi:AcrR family transcriptional regulator
MSTHAPRKSHDQPPSSRDRILACAVDLFALHGFDAMTMRQLGDAAGLDNSSLYRHFPSKAALVDAVLDHVAADVFAAIAPLADPATPLTLKRLEDICGAAGLYLFDHPAAARLIVHWIMSMGEASVGLKIAVPMTDKTRPVGKFLAVLRAQLDDAVKHGRLRKHASPDALVIAVATVVVRPATYGHLFKSLEPTRRREAARAAWEQELRATIRGAFAP